MAHHSRTEDVFHRFPDEHPVVYRRWDSGFIPELFFVESSEHAIAYADHVHDLLEIVWVRSGRCELICRGRHYAMTAGDAALVAPNAVHRGGSANCSRFSFSSLHVPRNLLQSMFGLHGNDGGLLWPLPPVYRIDGRSAENLYRDLVDGLPRCLFPGDQLSCLQDGLAGIFRRGSMETEGDTHPAVRKVKNIIGMEFTQAIDVHRLAMEVNLHQRYLISLFKQATGIPPHQYQIAMRVDYARRLLERDLSLSTVASAAGFADQSHFNRHFKRTYRMTPGAFRDHTMRL